MPLQPGMQPPREQLATSALTHQSRGADGCLTTASGAWDVALWTRRRMRDGMRLRPHEATIELNRLLKALLRSAQAVALFGSPRLAMHDTALGSLTQRPTRHAGRSASCHSSTQSRPHVHSTQIHNRIYTSRPRLPHSKRNGAPLLFNDTAQKSRPDFHLRGWTPPGPREG